MSTTQEEAVLTDEQCRVVALIAEGYTTTDDLAERLGVSRYTARTRLRRIRARLGTPASGDLTDLPRAARGCCGRAA